MSYAAAGVGNNKEATRAREAAYIENEEPLVKSTGTRVLSAEVPEIQNNAKNTNEKLEIENFSYLANKDNTPKMTLFKDEETKNQKTLASGDSVWKIPSVKDMYDEKKENKPGYVVRNENSSQGVSVKAQVENTTISNDSKYNEDYSKQEGSSLNGYNALDILKDMTLPSFDLKDVFDNIKNKDYVSAYFDVLRNIPSFAEAGKDVARVMWKTGSEYFLKPRGLNVSADMLEHSLQENPKDVVFNEYSEIAKKIKTNSKFLSKVDEMTEAIQNKTLNLGEKDELKFETNDDQDLYYSIHGCQVAIDNISYNKDGTKDISVHLSDTYDYTKIWTAMEGEKFSLSRVTLGTLANDLGTITSKMDAINPYKVDIYFTIRR